MVDTARSVLEHGLLERGMVEHGPLAGLKRRPLEEVVELAGLEHARLEHRAQGQQVAVARAVPRAVRSSVRIPRPRHILCALQVAGLDAVPADVGGEHRAGGADAVTVVPGEDRAVRDAVEHGALEKAGQPVDRGTQLLGRSWLLAHFEQTPIARTTGRWTR
jgi:hypothetical protein